MITDVTMTLVILAVALLLCGIAGNLIAQWRSQQRKLDQSERELADAISRHIELLA
jgi:hypothetical protein